jgi:hypothetical protein
LEKKKKIYLYLEKKKKNFFFYKKILTESMIKKMEDIEELEEESICNKI